MSRWLQETELRGDFVTLAPMRPHHREALIEAAADGELWRLWYTSVPSPENVDDQLRFAFREYEADRMLPFVVIDNPTGEIIGSTRYLNAEASHRRLEIGHTWYAKRCQGTAVNPESKLLLLAHAFEQLQTIAVEFRTHWHNHASRRAISKLGAKQDGVLRNHRIGDDGIFRDTVVFSILDSEWPAAKKSLLFRLESFASNAD
ncbi:MAG: GNAT family protein [Acidobacteriota bacterium]